MHKRMFAPDQISQAVRVESGGLELDCAERLQIVTRPHKLVTLTDQCSPAAEKFRSLAIRLRSFQKRQCLKRLLITSSIKGEGKSVISANLAVTLAQGQRTLLIDCDLHQSGLRDVFGTSGQPGITEWWKDSISAVSFVRRMPGVALWYLSAGEGSEHPLQILQSERFSEMLNDFSRWFDWIILDSPPLVPVADSAAIAVHVDGTLLVVRQANTPKPLLKEALKTENLKLLGIVANSWQGLEQSYYSRYYQGYMSQRRVASNNHPQLSSCLDTEL